jgi:hypothetical protein
VKWAGRTEATMSDKFRDPNYLVRLIIILFGMAFGSMWLRFMHPTPEIQDLIVLISIGIMTFGLIYGLLFRDRRR